MTIANVQVDQFHSMVVYVAFDQDGHAPDVFWGSRELRRVGVQQANGAGIAAYRMYRHNATDTRNIVIDWAGKTIPAAKAAFATMWSNCREVDLFDSNSMANTTVPRSGPLLTPNFNDSALTGGFCSEGPITDLAGSPSLGWLPGQRAGTSGGVDEDNITIQETYKIQTLIADTRARLSSVTARDFSIIMMTLEPEYTGTVSVTVSVPDVDATSQVEADALVEADVSTRFPPHWQVVVL